MESKKDKFKLHDKVQREPGGPVMEIVGFEPKLVENIIAQYRDDDQNLITAKFIGAELNIVKD